MSMSARERQTGAAFAGVHCFGGEVWLGRRPGPGETTFVAFRGCPGCGDWVEYRGAERERIAAAARRFEEQHSARAHGECSRDKAEFRAREYERRKRIWGRRRVRGVAADRDETTEGIRERKAVACA
jgi:hypothetical protein